MTQRDQGFLSVLEGFPLLFDPSSPPYAAASGHDCQQYVTQCDVMVFYVYRAKDGTQ